MKRLLLFLPLLALTACNYPSKYEAEIACDEWVKRGKEYIYFHSNNRDALDAYLAGDLTLDKFGVWRDSNDVKRKIRDCTHEKETRQYLGWDNGKKTGDKYNSQDIPDRKIVRRFRY